MILFYTALILCFVAARFVINRRVSRLEKKFIRTADEADRLLAESTAREGKPELLSIAGVPVHKKTQLKGELRPDPAQAAKRQYLLGILVQKRDRLEEKHQAWERRKDRLNAGLARIRSWKGRKVPYLLGVTDVSAAVYAIDYYGLREYISADRLMEIVNQVMAG